MKRLRTYARIYTRAARSLGLRTTQINDQTVDITYRNTTIRFYYAMNSLNDSVAASLSQNKSGTNALLRRARLPVFDQAWFSRHTRKSIKDYIKKIHYPVVVKPASGLQGHGITVNVRDEQTLTFAIDHAFEYGQRVIIEKYYPGTDYRVLICQDKVLALTHRLPAQVIGDGIHTIEELINHANEILPKKILLDQEIKNRLREHDATLHTILEPGQQVVLRYRANAALGGTTINIDPKQAHPDNLRACIKAVHTVGLKLAGVDFMTTDITQSYLKTKGGITEINHNPAIDIHSNASNPITNIAEQVVQILFGMKRALPKKRV
ncbi:MAG: hypothetical protein HZC01_00115 [Candidatus Kerfeldbacteria bacterium]|nr:hypothetical protein [Candidatus Kerfeldbacteria bacterium]